ncbi:alanine--tRNA ligase [Longimicrobium sp.]|uniref:alanine--tRNA ligase n=1 Tax=Longimicrobium sp. TaxID=2029185 RepID=UPI002BB8073E|nr:alanine--tRNA ligase [Longimicrobium sp.]HSU18008.1 alanine--tRNA ligase [Longimicrobium sp.]
MRSDEIRAAFLDYFARNGHEVRPSSSLVPADDPTLLFTNAGMVQFKKVFLGMENPGYTRAATSQKCVRAGGKHNDLENVGYTARHQTFFEMLGNFSFGDYFKRDAIRFAWELLTVDFGMDPGRLWVTVHYTDDEAAALWQEIAGLPETRIFRLGDKDNFWQMADTGPCGPCSEIHYDRRTEGLGTDVSREEFEELTEAGEILEFWNLVFMQYDRDADGNLTPLPAPSIDTGMGLERLTSILQGVATNYMTDLFTDIIARAVEIVGIPYEYDTPHGVSYRVLADHARATAFLLADGVFPSNEGRGYVLRRILRRAVRHAWLMGRREPTLAGVVEAVIDRMGVTYPELLARREYIVRNTRAEEERFLSTIDAGMRRFDEVAPAGATGTIGGREVFKLYDTWGFPVDLTELMAQERGYGIDLEGFEAELDAQRRRSREDRAASGIAVEADALSDGWEMVGDAAGAEQEFAAYRATSLETDILAYRRMDDGRIALQLRENPFYAESGGQISDTGHVRGDGWTMRVNEVRKVSGRVAVIGPVDGDFSATPVRAEVEESTRRDTERNHTATHLLHAALRTVLGEHVHQMGSLVSPDRLRFDFSHSGALTDDERLRIEEIVNREIWRNDAVRTEEMALDQARQRGAMALFGEKYGDRVRVVEIPGFSMELCGGTHVRSTGQIGLFRIVGESGVAGGVRRIEAVTGPGAYQLVLRDERTLREAAAALKTREENLLPRLQQVLAQGRELQKQLEKARTQGGGDAIATLIEGARSVDGTKVIATPVDAESADDLRALGDGVRERLGSGVAVLASGGERPMMLAVVTDDMITRGVRADAVIREVAALAGGKGGGKPHMAQAGIGDPSRVPEALGKVGEIVGRLLAGGTKS